MSHSGNDPATRAALRLRAVKRLGASVDAEITRAGALKAFGVLHEMAMAPDSAADALALMHELQVHQVELDLQEDELRNSRAAVELALERSTQLYDGAPVGCFTVERSTALVELNLTGAHLLGRTREALLGQSLDAFLTPRGADALHTLLEHIGAGQPAPACTLQLAPSAGTPRFVQASASIDPAGRRFLVAFIDIGAAQSRPAA